MTRWETKLKKSPSLQDKIGNIPAVLLGYDKSTSIAEASKEGRFTWFLDRPIHFHDLFHCVAKLCNREAPPLTSQLPSAPKTQFIDAPTVEEAAKAGLLVLVAEDNRMNRVVIGRQLAHLGYAVEFASDGQEAYNIWDKDMSRYGLLLTDRLMPVMDGFELSERVRSKESKIGSQRMPILMLTADVSKNLAERAALIGIDEYLRKPTDLETLRTILLKWLPKAAELQKRH
jgi:CheY-like chemotaxis protein